MTNEYIRKENVIQLLSALGGCDASDEWSKGFDAAISTAIDDVHAMPAADVQPVKWISVEDRLPEENTLVLCYARSTAGEGTAYVLGAIALGEFWFVSMPVLHWEVTHWQPLPEQPKDGDTE